ncbi:protein mono-ADP-ribosyltransferase PARP9 [Mustelus asterias]
MAVAFPDGRSTLIVSWKEHITADELQWILYTHFKDLAHSFQADCVMKKLDSQQVLVILTKCNDERSSLLVLNSIAENTHITYNEEEINLHIKIPVDDYFTVGSRNLFGEAEEIIESVEEEEIEPEISEQDEDKTDELETQEIKQQEEGLDMLGEWISISEIFHFGKCLIMHVDRTNATYAATNATDAAPSSDGKHMKHGSEGLSQSEMCIEIPVQNDVGRFLQNKNTLLLKIILGKFNCTATLCTNETKQSVSTVDAFAENFPAAGRAISPITSFPTGVRYLKILHGGLRVFTCLNDLTKHHVDVVVNSANEYLKHDSGLARDLARTAGQEFVIESDNIVQQHGAVPIGSAVFTGAGKLPCKMVIHAVGPIWNTNSSLENDRLLSYAIRNSLVLANELEMTSIALPALGLENGYPLQRCVEMIVSTVNTFHGIWMPKDPLKEIHLVDFSEPTTAALETACKNIFGETDQKNLLSIDFSPNRNRDICTFRNLHIEIRRENIEEQNTDVIVNTIYRDLNLNSDTVSRAIAEMAGPELQKELHRIKKTELLAYGDVLKTSGFNLSCEYVYHVAYYPPVNFGKEKLLKKIVARFLELVKEDDIRSISIPVTTHSTHELSPNKLARLFIEQLINYIECNENFRFTTVHFVLNPVETIMYEAFLQELSRVKQLASQRSRNSSLCEPTTFNLEEEERTEVLIKVCGKDYSFLECAQFWITDFILTPQEYLIIENKSINYFTVAENEALKALQEKNQITMHTTVNEMGAFIELNGPHFEILEVALHIESLLCDLQEKMVRAIEAELLQTLVHWVYIHEGERHHYGPTQNLTLEKAVLDNKTLVSFEVNGTQQAVCLETFMALDDHREEFKVERINILDAFFFKTLPDISWDKKELDTATLKIDSQISTLYQRVPEHFCNFVCRIGFQEIYSQEHVRRFGEGIYFSNDLSHLIREVPNVGKIVHIFEAEVFTGNCCKVPSSHVSSDHRDCPCYEYSENTMDNVHPFKTYVMYNSVQAYPRYLIACKKRLSLY